MKKTTVLFSMGMVLLVALWGCNDPNQTVNNPSDDQTSQTENSTDNQSSTSETSGDGATGTETATSTETTDMSTDTTEETSSDTSETTETSNASSESTGETAEVDSPEVQLAHHIEMSKGTTIRIAASSEPRYLMPNGTEGTWESQISGQIFEYLVETNDRFEHLPAMAHSWEWNPDELSYTFHIRDGIKFHDYAESGETLDCADVMFSFKAWIHPDYPGVRFSNFEKIVGAQEYHDGVTTDWPIPGLQCLDDKTFKVTLTEVQRTFLSYAIASSGIMPQHVYEPFFEENGYAMLKGVDSELGETIGTGPYKLDEWSAAQYVKLERFDDYWRGRWGRQVEVEDQVSFPGIDQVYWMIMPDTDSQYAALLAGEIDVLDTRGSVDQHFQLAENPNFSTVVYPQLTYDYWHWNLREERFQDVRVRQAMCYALDRQKLIDNVLRGLGDLTNGPTNPLRWDWDESLNEIHPNYDPAKVVQLMEEAGWTIQKNEDGTIAAGAAWKKMGSDGNEMTMEFEIAHNTPNPRRRDFALIMQSQLKKLGFQSTVAPMETNAFYNDYLAGSNDFQTAIAGWRMGTDPDGTSLWHTKSLDPAGFNWIAYSNPEVDRLLEEGLQIATIDEARPVYQAINKLLVEDMGYCWLAFPSATFAARPDLDGMDQWSPLSPYSHLTEWYWEGKGVPVTVME